MPYPCVVHFVLEAFNSVSEISRVDSDIIQFKLLVIAYNNQQDPYLLFSKTFYNKIVIETLARENESDILSIYMNSEYYEESEFEVLIVTSKNKPDIALVYDQKFDEMTEYIQKPKSEIEDSESEE